MNRHYLFSLLTRKLLVTTLLTLSTATYAFDLSVGAGGVEEGDDRLRPVGAFMLGLGESFVTKAFLWGRTYGPVTERSTVISLNYRFAPLGPSSMMRATMGAVYLSEYTSVEQGPDAALAADEVNQAIVGMAFGLDWTIPFGPAFLRFNWDSNIFIAGTAGMLLSTGRKHMLSLGTGFRF